jgi:diacylglycerol kinase (ATP)
MRSAKESGNPALAEKIVVILNPAARSERARALSDRIPGFAERTIVWETTKPGEARLLAELAAKEGYTMIVAAGGDGTVNDVVNGIARSGVTLGLLPFGTMNVFATELGLPANNLRACWEIIEAGHVRRVDLARADSHYFVQLAGIGLDAQVVQATSWDMKKSLGPLSYLVSAATVAARKPPRLVVESESGSVEGSFVLIGNGRYYGGPFVIFKQARIDDGLLDVLIFKNLGYLDIVRYLQGIIFGTHVRMPDVEYFQTRKVTVRSGEEVPVEIDGEVIGTVPMTFRLSSRKLNVITREGK